MRNCQFHKVHYLECLCVVKDWYRSKKIDIRWDIEGAAKCSKSDAHVT